MSIPVFPPTKENELQAWSLNWSTLISSTAVAFGLSAAQATVYAALHSAWSAAYALVITPAGNSKANIAAKNLAKENLLNGPGGAWDLVNIVQAFPGMTDAIRVELGLRIPDASPTPIPPPEQPPLLSIMSTSGRTLTIRLRDKQNPDRRGKPVKVQGATVLYHVGETTPADPSQWMFFLNESRTEFFADVPPVVPAGSKVWITAFWFNNRKQSGPVAIASSTFVDEIGNEALAAAA